MSVILDTSILVELESKNLFVIDKLKDILNKYPSKPQITSLTYSEFYYGCLRKSKKEQESILKELDRYFVLDTTKESSKLFAEIKLSLEKEGKQIPSFDIMIASIAIANNSILVTTDPHFKNIRLLNTILLKQEKE